MVFADRVVRGFLLSAGISQFFVLILEHVRRAMADFGDGLVKVGAGGG